MNVAFCINRLALIGFGVTVCSVIRNCSAPKKLKLYFLCAGLKNQQKADIRQLLASENFTGTHHFIDFDPIASFGSFRSLHGDWTTYGRLLLPELVNEDRILYLDSDLAVEVDVLDIEKFDFDGKALAAVHGGVLVDELEHNFYINKLKLTPNSQSFNAGILLFDLQQWRQKNLKEECLKVARLYPSELLSCDQALLNAVFAGRFAKLPASFNCTWLPYLLRPKTADKMILHFVGSPKPWDPLGFLIHNGYNVWKKYLNQNWASLYAGFTVSDVRRTWNIRKSYIRCINQKLKKHPSPAND